MWLRAWVLAIGALLPMACSAATAPDAIVGTWLTDDGASKVEIAAAKGTDGVTVYNGRVAWLKVPVRDGKPIHDANNADATLRERPIIGLEIVSGFKPAAGGGWTGGTVYSPRSGKSFPAELQSRRTAACRSRSRLASCRRRCTGRAEAHRPLFSRRTTMQRWAQIRSLLAGSVLLALSGVAAAQWVMLARHAVGRIEQMQQTAPKTADGATGASYDVATVIVEVAPNKVFDTIQVMLGKNPALKVTRSDAAKRSVEFTDGKQIGGIQVNTLGDNLSQLMISTAHPGIAASTTSTIVERILAVCKELNVQCQPAQP